MNETAKSGTLFVAVILMLFGVFCLRYRMAVHRSELEIKAAGSPKNSAIARPSQLPLETELARPAPLASPPPNRIAAEATHVTEALPLVRPPPAAPALPIPPYSTVRSESAQPDSSVQPAAFDAPVQLPALATESESNPPQHVELIPVPEVKPTASPVTLEPSRNEFSPASVNSGVVVTEADDSLWRISKTAYGRGDYFKALYLHNKAQLAHPDRIAAGTQIVTPSTDELRRLYPTACPAEQSAVAP